MKLIPFPKTGVLAILSTFLLTFVFLAAASAESFPFESYCFLSTPRSDFTGRKIISDGMIQTNSDGSSATADFMFVFEDVHSSPNGSVLSTALTAIKVEGVPLSAFAHNDGYFYDANIDPSQVEFYQRIAYSNGETSERSNEDLHSVYFYCYAYDHLSHCGLTFHSYRDVLSGSSVPYYVYGQEVRFQ